MVELAVIGIGVLGATATAAGLATTYVANLNNRISALIEHLGKTGNPLTKPEGEGLYISESYTLIWFEGKECETNMISKARIACLVAGQFLDLVALGRIKIEKKENALAEHADKKAKDKQDKKDKKEAEKAEKLAAKNEGKSGGTSPRPDSAASSGGSVSAADATPDPKADAKADPKAAAKKGKGKEKEKVEVIKLKVMVVDPTPVGNYLDTLLTKIVKLDKPQSLKKWIFYEHLHNDWITPVIKNLSERGVLTREEHKGFLGKSVTYLLKDETPRENLKKHLRDVSFKRIPANGNDRAILGLFLETEECHASLLPRMFDADEIPHAKYSITLLVQTDPPKEPPPGEKGAEKSGEKK